MTNRDTVLFDNHVKRRDGRCPLQSSFMIPMDGIGCIMMLPKVKKDKTLFSYRLYLGNAFTVNDIPPANLCSYFVKNRDKYYCRWDLAQKSLYRWA